MKKTDKPGPDISGLVNDMRQQLAVMERKIDTLISRSSQRPVEAARFSAPVRSFDRPHQGAVQFPRQQNNFNNKRTLHKAVCADCRKECEVPFKPSDGRPVYCQECFARRRNGGNRPPAGPENRPGAVALAQANQMGHAALKNTAKKGAGRKAVIRKDNQQKKVSAGSKAAKKKTRR
jgi:CxxC-x17-CxxC domain-containing protein